MDLLELCRFSLEAEDNVAQSLCVIPEPVDPNEAEIKSVEVLLACSNGQLLHLCMAQGASALSAQSGTAAATAPDAMEVDSGASEHSHSVKGSPSSTTWSPAFCFPIMKDVYALQAVTCVSTPKFYFAATGGLGKELHCALMPVGGFFKRVATLPVKAPIADIFIQHDSTPVASGDTIRWSCTLIFGGEDKRLHLWLINWTFSSDFSNIEYAITLKRTYSGHNSYIRSIAINTSPTATEASSQRLDLLATGADDSTTRTWPVASVADFSDSTTCNTHIDSVLSVDFKNNILASGSKDYLIKIVDLPEHQKAAAASRKHTAAVDAVGRYEIRTPSVVRSVILSDDATIILAGGGDGIVRVWKREPCERENSHSPSSRWIPQLPEHRLHQSSIMKMNARCGFLVSCGVDRTVTLCRMRIGNPH